MKIAKHLPAFSLGVLILFSIVFGALLGKGLAATVNTINTENFTDFETALPTRLLDVHGELITEFASDERREIIAIRDLPQHMKDALLTVLYRHKIGYISPKVTEDTVISFGQEFVFLGVVQEVTVVKNNGNQTASLKAGVAFGEVVELWFNEYVPAHVT